jgi:hypothetical protein
MSIASRARQVKRPSGDPKRVRNARPKPAPFNVTEFADAAHKARLAADKIVLPRWKTGIPVPGAFGGPKITRASRAAVKAAKNAK